MARLFVTISGKVLKEIQITEETTRIGRDRMNHIQIDNPAVSRFHAEIYRQGWAYYIEDKQSTNGTYINGSFVNWKRGINNNDKITIGKHTLIFMLDKQELEGTVNPKGFDPCETVCVVPKTDK